MGQIMNNITELKPSKDKWIDEAFNKDKPEYKVTHLSELEKEAKLIEEMHRN